MKMNLQTLTNTEAESRAMNELENIIERIDHLSTLVESQRYENMKELIKPEPKTDELDDRNQMNALFIKLEQAEMIVMKKRIQNQRDRFIEGEPDFDPSQELIKRKAMQEQDSQSFEQRVLPSIEPRNDENQIQIVTKRDREENGLVLFSAVRMSDESEEERQAEYT